jgi:hypothetical protein
VLTLVANETREYIAERPLHEIRVYRHYLGSDILGVHGADALYRYQYSSTVVTECGALPTGVYYMQQYQRILALLHVPCSSSRVKSNHRRPAIDFCFASCNVGKFWIRTRRMTHLKTISKNSLEIINPSFDSQTETTRRLLKATYRYVVLF